MIRMPRPGRPNPAHIVVEVGPLTVSWEQHDTQRSLTTAALLGLSAAFLLAVFGLPPIDIHGPLHYVGIMGPTCGITRGVMWFSRGELSTAWTYNPLSLLMVPGAALLMGRAGYGWWSGRWLQVSVRRDHRLIALVVLGVILLTIRQQLHVDLLS